MYIITRSMPPYPINHLHYMRSDCDVFCSLMERVNELLDDYNHALVRVDTAMYDTKRDVADRRYRLGHAFRMLESIRSQDVSEANDENGQVS